MGPRACTLWNFATFLCLLVCIAFQFSVFVYNYRKFMTIDERLDNLERMVEWLFERGASKESLKPPANQNKPRALKSLAFFFFFNTFLILGSLFQEERYCDMDRLRATPKGYLREITK